MNLHDSAQIFFTFSCFSCTSKHKIFNLAFFFEYIIFVRVIFMFFSLLTIVRTFCADELAFEPRDVEITSDRKFKDFYALGDIIGR